jgi:hypothetical protein
MNTSVKTNQSVSVNTTALGVVVPPGPTVLTANIIAAEAIKAGDIVVIGSDGLGHYALPPDAPGAMFRPIIQPSPINVANGIQETIILAPSAANTSNHIGEKSILLPNGNVVFIYTAGGNTQASVVSLNGSLVGSQILGANDGIDFSVDAVLLSNGNIAAFFHVAPSSALAMAVIDKNANFVLQTAIIETSTGGGAISADVMIDGNLIVAYTDGQNRSPKIQIRTASGGVVTAGFIPNTSSAPVANNTSVSVNALKAGGFSLVYATTDGTNGQVYACVFSGIGSALSNNIQVGQPQTGSTIGAFVKSVALPDGGFAVVAYGGNGPGFALNIFNNNAQPQGANIVLDAYDGNDSVNRAGITVLENGNIAVIWRVFGNAYGAVYTTAGLPIVQKTSFGAFSSSVAITTIPRGGAAVALQGASELFIGALDNNLSGNFTAALPAGLQNSIPLIQPIAAAIYTSATGLIAGTVSSNVTVGIFASYKIDQATPIGVATTATGANQDLTVQTAGVATVRLSFGQPYSLDANNNTPPGQKMSVIGNTAILKGIQQ